MPLRLQSERSLSLGNHWGCATEMGKRARIFLHGGATREIRHLTNAANASSPKPQLARVRGNPDPFAPRPASIESSPRLISLRTRSWSHGWRPLPLFGNFMIPLVGFTTAMEQWVEAECGFEISGQGHVCVCGFLCAVCGICGWVVKDGKLGGWAMGCRGWVVGLIWLWTCLKGRFSMLLKLLNTASTWMICQEAMVENRRYCKPPLCNWIWIVDFWAWKVLSLVAVSTKRNSCSWGASFVKQFVKPYPMYLWKTWWLHLRTWIYIFLFFHVPLAAHFIVCSVLWANLMYLQSEERWHSGLRGKKQQINFSSVFNKLKNQLTDLIEISPQTSAISLKGFWKQKLHNIIMFSL